MATVAVCSSDVPPQRTCWKELREPPEPHREDLADAHADGPGPCSQGCSRLMTEHSTETRTRPFHPSVQEASRGLSTLTSSSVG